MIHLDPHTRRRRPHPHHQLMVGLGFIAIAATIFVALVLL